MDILHDELSEQIVSTMYSLSFILISHFMAFTKKKISTKQ